MWNWKSIPSREEIDEMILKINEADECIRYVINEEDATKQQIIDSMFSVLNTPPTITQSVWELLEKQSPQFFRAYYSRVDRKDRDPLTIGLLPPDVQTKKMPKSMKRCFNGDMTMQETMEKLFTDLRIPPAFTQLVWENLERQDPKLFHDYYARLADVSDSDGQSSIGSHHSTEHMLDVKKDAPSGSGGGGVEHSQQKLQQMMWTPTAGEQGRPTTEEEEDLFDDGDDEFEEFEIKQEGNDEEAGKEITRPWEADWDDDDDDFSVQLKKELDKSK